MKRTYLLTVDIKENADPTNDPYWSTFLQEHIQRTFKDRYPNSIMHAAEVSAYDLPPDEKEIQAVAHDLRSYKGDYGHMPDELLETAAVYLLAKYDPRSPWEKLSADQQESLVSWLVNGSFTDDVNEDPEEYARQLLAGYSQEEIDIELNARKELQESNEAREACGHLSEADNILEDHEDHVQNLIDRDKEN